MTTPSGVSNAPLNVFVDITPVRQDPQERTGLARVAIELTSALTRHPDLDVTCGSIGNAVAATDLAHVADLPELPIIQRQPGFFAERYCAALSRCRRRTEFPSLLVRGVGWALSRWWRFIPEAELRRCRLLFSTYAPFPSWAARSCPQRVILVHDLTPLRIPHLIDPTFRATFRRTLARIRRDEHVVCVSRNTARDFCDETGHPAERVSVIYNGVNLERFRPKTNSKAIANVRNRFGIGLSPFALTLSSLQSHKNIALLYTIWPFITERCPDAKLVLVGQPAPHIAKAMMPARKCDGIIYTGFLQDNDIVNLLNAANVFLFPSVYEGFGLPILEAMACGLPVIASNTSALPEVVGSAGTSLPPTDTTAWVEAVRSALSNGVRTEPVENCLAWAQSFSWARAADEYATLFKRIA